MVVEEAMAARSTRFVALFRGINVGKAKRIAMADLRAVFDELGFTEVKTLLNSGNVVFTHAGARRGIDQRIEAAVEKELGVASRTLVLSAKDVATLVEESPFEEVADPSRLLVATFAGKAGVKQVESLGGDPNFGLGSRAAYLWCPDGVLKSSLPKELDRLTKKEYTARNWRTLLRIQDAL